jgi:hypothetical protein
MRWSFMINPRLWKILSPSKEDFYPYHSIGLFLQTSVLMPASLTEDHSYGNLYLANDAFPGCEKAEIIGEVPQSLKEEVENRFVIGPVVDRGFWHRERASMDIDRGPCELYRTRITEYQCANVTLREKPSRVS